MAKISEFMQHSQLIAQLLKGHSAGDATSESQSVDAAGDTPDSLDPMSGVPTGTDAPPHDTPAASVSTLPPASTGPASQDVAEVDTPVDGTANDEAHTSHDLTAGDQTLPQDEIVSQTDTSATTPESGRAAEEAAPIMPSMVIFDDDDPTAQYSDSGWEEALQSLHAPQRPLQRLMPMGARIGVLGLVAVALWWTWPRDDDSSLWVSDARAGELPSLAVINPLNVEQTGVVARAASPTLDATGQAEQFTNIVIVTPTATQVENAGSEDVDAALEEPLVLEASALVTDAETGAIIIEIPEAVPVEAMMPALQEESAAVGQTEIVLIPTATPSPTAHAAAEVEAAAVPKVEIVPAIGVKFTPTAENPTPTVTPTEAPTATPPPIGPGRLWSTFNPLPASDSDHFWIGNPFEGMSSNRFASPSYQFGSTAGNRYRPHHGLDFSNPSGTPVQAAVEGTVVHAGPDDPDVLGPYPNFYGKAVVIRLDQQLPVAGGQLDVFVLYGHLSDVRAEVGQHVQPSDIIGLVGMTGIAIGPHLHVEARLGANTYDHSVNPYLWLKPTEGNGAVAVRVLTAKGRTWAGAKVSIARFEGGRAVWGRQIETYLDTENIGPDPNWGENGAMGDVPAGAYYLIATINGESVRAEFTVNAGETTFVEIRTEQ
jgi:murein DD-endopeptidase MepM/ murein hydrolase activator NlpD